MPNRRQRLGRGRLAVRASNELYDMILSDSQRLGISMGEVLTRVYAEAKGDPELGVLQKEKPGPKPKRRQLQSA